MTKVQADFIYPVISVGVEGVILTKSCLKVCDLSKQKLIFPRCNLPLCHMIENNYRTKENMNHFMFCHESFYVLLLNE